MAWNGSGTFSRTNGTHTGSSTWVQDRDAGDYILASRHDTHDQDLADGIGACLTKNNETKPTAHFRPNADATYDLGSAALQWMDAYLSGKILAGNGTAAAPSYSFGSTGNDDNGMYMSGNNTLAFATAGAKQLEIASNGDAAFTAAIRGPDGSASFPTFSFTSSGNSDNGMYLSASNELSWATAGAQSMKLTSGADGGLTVIGTGSSIPMPAFSATPVTMNTGYTNSTLVVTKSPTGIVHCRGYANKDSAATGALLYFTLASGYRPSTTTIHRPVYNSNDGYIDAQVGTNGQVTVTHTSSNNGNTYFDISFPTT